MAHIATNTLQVRWIWDLNGVDYAVNVVHYLVGPTVTVSQATADDYGDDLGTAFNTSGLNTWISNQVRLQRCTVRDLRVANQPEFSFGVNAPGTLATDLLPLANSLVVTLRTALAGRSFRGRVYLPGFTEAANTSVGEAVAGARTAANDFVSIMVDPIVQAQEWSLGVTSRQRDGVALEPAVTQAVTATVVRDPRWDVQRRRSNPGI